MWRVLNDSQGEKQKNPVFSSADMKRKEMHAVASGGLFLPITVVLQTRVALYIYTDPIVDVKH